MTIIETKRNGTTCFVVHDEVLGYVGCYLSRRAAEQAAPSSSSFPPFLTSLGGLLRGNGLPLPNNFPQRP